MFGQKLTAVKPGIVLAFLSSLALSSSAWAADAQPVLPMGVLAHAAMATEESFGGKILEIRLADEKGDPVFEAAMSKGGGIVYLRIESPSDNVTEIKLSELPAWLTNYKLEAYMRSIEQAKVPLAEAILKAEQRAKAPAIGAGIAKPLSGSNAVLAYYVETIKDGKRQTLAVDAKTGAFISNPDELYEPHTPVKLARRLAP